MRSWCRISCLAVLVVDVSAIWSQTPNPVLGNIEGPYAPLQNSVTIAQITWTPGAVNYGPINTPLVLSGSNLGGGGSVNFVPYKNGVVDTTVPIAQATVTLWTSNMIILTVPSGAYTGLVTVTVEGNTSNGLPFVVTPGTYSNSCPAGPSNTQIQIVTSSLHDGAVSQSYSATLQASGGTTPYSWSISKGTLPAGLTLNASTGTISGTPTSASGSNPTPITFQVKDSESPSLADQAEVSITIEAQTMSSGTVYSYTVGYDGDSNVSSFHDSTYNGGSGVMGAWSYTYDTLNRLASGTATWPDATQQFACWSYDVFGNRFQQELSSAAFVSPSGGANSCTPQSSAWVETDINGFLVNGTTDPGNNHVQTTNARGISATMSYDASGNSLNDGANQYLYDAEGRICAVQSSRVPGMTTFTGYLYDADGNRVAKGNLSHCTSLSNCSCDPTTNGFQFTENYVLGPASEELTMLDGSNNWQRTNLYVGGKLIGTYDLVNDPTNSSNQIPWLHFHLQDPLGTRRMQVSGMLSNLGQPEIDFQNLPFGDQLASFIDPYADQAVSPPSQYNYQTIDGSTPLHFTGKERDAESGNDYFGARYYSSAMGRFLSSDWSESPVPIPSASLTDPQSLNLFSYTRNNPLTRKDDDGHCDDDGGIHGKFWCFLHALGLNESNSERSARIEDERNALLNGRHRDGTPLTPAEKNALQGASQNQIDKLYGDVLVKQTQEYLKSQSRQAWMSSGTVADVNNSWHEGSFDSAEESLHYHFEDHGADVDAESETEYLRKAETFKSNLKGARPSPVEGFTEGVVRWSKNGKYIDLAPDGRIVSFGKL